MSQQTRTLSIYLALYTSLLHFHQAYFYSPSNILNFFFQQQTFPMLNPSQNSVKPPKSTTTLQLVSNYSKNQQQRARLLKQLQQLGLDVSEYEHLSLTDLTKKTEYIMNNTYSIKYLGLNKNQMGIISRRINPLTDQELKVHEDVDSAFSVHKYFYPKPLKTGKKNNGLKPINVDNLESQIKKEFQEKKRERILQVKKSKENRDQKLKTKMMGSWYSHDPRKKQKQEPQNAYIGESITPKIDPSQSFSRFLSKGVLIVRD